MSPTFSERYGYTSVRTSIQHESLDKPLRTDLWNTTFVVFKTATNSTTYSEHSTLCVHLWSQLWHRNLDELPYHTGDFNPHLKHVFMEGNWTSALDLVEFMIKEADSAAVTAAYNRDLEKNVAGYRIASKEIVPIDSEIDLSEIQEALAAAEPFAGVKHHLRKALTLLSNRETPDYANSVKESISAVEAICNLIIGGQGTLGQALKKLNASGVEIHPALEKAWQGIYGYTSDADGIRHWASELPTVSQADAKYFLVSCSAFTNLLLAETARVGLSLDG